jgi:hypothetical protein
MKERNWEGNRMKMKMTRNKRRILMVTQDRESGYSRREIM